MLAQLHQKVVAWTVQPTVLVVSFGGSLMAMVVIIISPATVLLFSYIDKQEYYFVYLFNLCIFGCGIIGSHNYEAKR
jgi:hypothetical protein